MGPAKLDAKFSDPGNGTAKALAEAEGISVGAATSRLRSIDNAARQIRKLEERFPERYAGAVVEIVRGKAKVVVYRTGQADLADADLDPKVAGSIEQRSAKMSRGQMKKFGRDLAEKLEQLGIEADIAVSAPLHSVRILARDPSSVNRLVDIGQLELDDFVTVEQFDGIVTTAPSNIGSGHAANTDTTLCTVGFTVLRTSTGERGTTTAGHCGNRLKVSENYSSTYTSSSQASTSFKGQWIRSTNLDFGIDLQWHTSSATPVPQIWNGSNWVGITGGKDDLAGEFVCKFGRITGQICGTIDTHEYYDSTYRGYFPRVNRAPGGPQLNIEGDSGGPVYQGSLAVGWVHGRDAIYNMYYTPLRNLSQNGTGLAVLTIYP